ncbi:Glucosamine-6-phosphate deaminase [isomerizing], alternative [hydrothermal vent metagenome]|uniref:Glucosamine-6-phosphate deaminase [isomerizing], alternative n=1 Tax=hydrothermal vent metagenome TaxID=652676 RepID=A0A3B0UCF4_9ZZZZ
MSGATTHMHNEVAEIPEAIARFLDLAGAQLKEGGAALRARDPALIATIARGSSDHAAAFLKYAIELSAGVPVASLAPSVASIYGAPLRLSKAATISISQSGASPDLVAMTQTAKDGGALSFALTNNPRSSLALIASHAINIAAGPEISVAATKSFVCSVVAGLALIAEWQDDDQLRQALARLPEHAARALECDWSQLVPALDRNGSLFVLGRGPAMAIANEVALKFKETCALHAEAYSSAEVMHGPVALVEKGFPVLALCARDLAEISCVKVAKKLAGSGAKVFLTADAAIDAKKLDFVATGHPLSDALCLIIPFYVFVEKYSRHLGSDPDVPSHLHKVTRTR